MDRFVVLLNDIEVEEPRGFNELQEEVLRDDNFRVITLNYNGTLDFFGTAYNYLEELYFQEYCTIVRIKVIKKDNLIINSTINLADSEWEINKRIVSCEIEEPFFQQRIFNNYDAKIYIASPLSISGEDITPCATDLIDVHKPDDDSALWNDPREAWDYFDCARYMISYLTDDEADFSLTGYDEFQSDDDKLFMMPGANALYADPTGTQLSPLTSFKDYWENTWRMFNCWMIVSAGSVQILPESELYSEDVVTTQVFRKDLMRSLDLDRLYGRIQAGSDKAIKNLGNSTADDSPFPYIFFRAFAREEFKIAGVCATDQPLNLQLSYIPDVNKWQVLLDEVETNYNRDPDEDVYLVFCELNGSGTWDAKDYDYFDWNTPKLCLNGPLLNENIIKRFDLQGDVILNSGLLTINFLAFRVGTHNLSGTISASIPPAPTIDVEDPVNAEDVTAPGFAGSAYNAPTSTFTAPVNDIYSFEIEQFFEILPGDVVNTAVLVFDLGIELDNNPSLRTYSSLLEKELLEANGSPVPEPNPITDVEAAFFMNGLLENGRVRIRVKAFLQVYMEASQTATAIINLRGYAQGGLGTDVDVHVYDGSFAQVANGTAGGDYDPKDPNLYHIHLIEFEGDMTDEEFASLKANPKQRIVCTDKDNLERYGYVKSVSRNIVTGKTEFSIIFNRNQPNF